MSRLPVEAPDAARVAQHAARRAAGKVLVANHAGGWALLEESDYRRYLKGGVSNEEPLGVELRQGGFFRDYQDFRSLARRMAERERLGAKGPALHAFDLGGGAAPVMDAATAAAAAAFAFRSGAPCLRVELGGEAALARPALAALVVGLAKARAASAGKSVSFALRAPAGALDASVARRWAELTGAPAAAVAVFSGGRADGAAEARRLRAAGFARVRLEAEDSVPAPEWGAAYRAFLGEALAAAGFVEEGAAALAAGLLGRSGPAAGRGGLGRLAYAPDGTVYAGAAASWAALGPVATTDYVAAMDSEAMAASWLAAAPFLQAVCSGCAYAAFCPTTPAERRAGLWGDRPREAWCARALESYDAVMERISDPGGRKALEAWANDGMQETGGKSQ